MTFQLGSRSVIVSPPVPSGLTILAERCPLLRGLSAYSNRASLATVPGAALKAPKTSQNQRVSPKSYANDFDIGPVFG